MCKLRAASELGSSGLGGWCMEAVPGKALVVIKQLWGPGLVEIPEDLLPATASLQPWKSSLQRGALKGSPKYIYKKHV